jgi:hypothetical protein
MEILMQLIGVGLGLFILVLLSPFAVYGLAYFNLFFTFPEEGRGMAVMQSKKFHNFIIKLAGHKINPKTWDIVELEEGETEQDRLNWLEKQIENRTGARWIGIPPFRNIYSYPFEWATVRRRANGSGGESIIEAPNHKVETSSHFLVGDSVYYGKIIAAETKENLKVDVEYLLTLRIVNPYKALFLVHRWLDAILDLASQAGRRYIGTRLFSELVSKEGTSQEEGFSAGIKGLTELMLENYGIKFVYTEILSVGLSGDMARQHEEATIAGYLADSKATAVKTAAKAEGKAIKKIGEARAAAIESQRQAIEASPEAAKLVYDLEKAKQFGGLGSLIENATRAFLNATRGDATS